MAQLRFPLSDYEMRQMKIIEDHFVSSPNFLELSDEENSICFDILSAMKERRLSLIRNTMIGFIFQSFHLIPSLSALENVELPLIYRGLRRRERFFLANSALERVGLANRLTHKPSELSGGQQQRVAIARAIALRPKLILADEPTGNLDSRSGEGIMDILKGLHREGSAMVIITHDPKIAVMAERCIKISDGRILN